MRTLSLSAIYILPSRGQLVSQAIPVTCYRFHGRIPEGIQPVRDSPIPGPVAVVIQVPDAVQVCAYLLSLGAVTDPGYRLHGGCPEGILPVRDGPIPGPVTVVVQVPGAVAVRGYFRFRNPSELLCYTTPMPGTTGIAPPIHRYI